MNRKPLVLVLFLLFAPRLIAKPAPSVSVKKLNGSLYELTSHGEYEVNLLASIGNEGLLLVDTGLPVEKGVDGLIARYGELKATQSEAYLFAPHVLGSVSVLMGKRGETGDAVGISLFNTREFPGSGASWYFLGEAYLRAGDRARAIEALKKGVALSPDDPGISASLAGARNSK